jgi:hypothetical protein
VQRANVKIKNSGFLRDNVLVLVEYYFLKRLARGRLVKGKTLADLFADKALALEIFDAAIESGAPRSFVLHQKAVFELNHPGGNMRYALEVVTEAESLLQQPDRSIQHTKAVIFRRLALESDRPLERSHLRNEARQLLRKLQSNARTPHAINTYAQLLLDEITERLGDWSGETAGTSGELEERAIADLIRQAEEALFNGLQQFPGDEYLLALDAKLAALLRDEPRAITSLQKAFLAHPARAFVAVRLARIQAAADRTDEARATLEKCLAANPSSKEAHLELARLYMADGEQARKQEIGYHLKRSFTEGDSNFAAQALWARHEFLYGIRSAGLEMFRKLSDARTSSADKTRVQGIVTDNQRAPLRYSGYVRSVHNGYCFASCADLGCDIFLSRRALKDVDWHNVRQGSHVDFLLGFSMRGPQGVHARLN